MADNSDIRSQAGKAAGQAQVKKDDLMSKASQTAQETQKQAAGFIGQTGEQVKNLAQGATDAVKNAVGMADNNTSSTTSAVTKHKW